MIVTFLPNAKRNLVMTHDGRTINMHRGKYKTADKDVIRMLINSKEYKSKAFEVETPMELVNKYLSDEQPDKLTKSVLNNITHEGLTVLANHLQLRNHGNYATVIRTMAEGEYIDNKVEKIIEQYKAEQPAEDLVEQGKEVGVFWKDGPWNKFLNPETGEEQQLGKSPSEIGMFVEKNRDLVLKAIQKTENKDG